MKCSYACHSPEHGIARRSFLGSLGLGIGGLAGFGGMIAPAAAKQLSAAQKRVLVVFLAGGVSQLETWDPKPKTKTGGPFAAIPTSVPGVHISELLPHCAQQMHRLSLVRSINTKENDHGKGKYCMTTGRRREPSTDYPHLGAVSSKLLAPESSPLPGFIQITADGSGSSRKDSAYLGPKYASMTLGNGKPPQNSIRPESLTPASDQARNAFRQQANDRFTQRRRTAMTDAYSYSYEQAAQLMERHELFDVSKEPAKELERYGEHDFGRHCLLARRLLEAGVTFVQVTHSNYDTHYENFEFHIEQLGEFDQPFATLLSDLADRGMLESTLVVVMSEFGRTPTINARYGRDHWGTAWSVALGGCRIQPGAVIGKTNELGTAVADRQVDHGHLFHTYLQAVGLNSSDTFDVDGRPMPVADPSASAIQELLA
jgi:uncharacterized protein (DUF1501 family)